MHRRADGRDSAGARGSGLPVEPSPAIPLGMLRRRILTHLALALMVVAACGGNDDDDVVAPDANMSVDANAGGPDGGPVPSAANVGQPCGGAGSLQCPGPEMCITIRNVGSTTEGFCTVSCTGLDDMRSCTFEYVGPGEARCVIDDGADGFQCAIDCTTDGLCPTGLACFDTDEGDIRLCAGDEGT